MTQKVFIVTGASKGLGAAIIKYLLDDSHKLVLTARSGDLLEGIKVSWPGQVEYIAGDWESSPDLAERLMKLAVGTFGKIDGLVLNHGMLQTTRLEQITTEEMKQVFQVNLFSCLSLAQASLAHLRESKGCVLWVSSGASVGAYGGWGSYGASKSAMNHLCKTLALEEPDITSVAMTPPRTNTGMQAKIRSSGRAGMIKEQYDSFVTAFEQGNLIEPEVPGHVMAKFVAEPRRDLSGQFVFWNSPELAAYQP